LALLLYKRIPSRIPAPLSARSPWHEPVLGLLSQYFE
jgi:hypothetical protein